MQRLTILAASPSSGRAMLAALSGFHAEMLEDGDGSCEVVVSLGSGDSEIVGVLNALEQYVTERGDGPAKVELNGRTYVMHPLDDDADGMAPASSSATYAPHQRPEGDGVD